MVKANVDRILDILKEKKSVSVNELANKLSLPKTDVEKSAEYLEEDGVVKIDHKFPNTYVTLIKQPGKKEEKPAEETKEEPQQPSSVSTVPEQEDSPTDISSSSMPLPPPPEQIVPKTSETPSFQPPSLTKPEPNLPKEETLSQQQPSQSQPTQLSSPQSSTTETPEEDKKPNKTPFLIDEPKQPDDEKNVSASMDIMKQSPVQEIEEPQPDLNENPIEPEQPKFDMAPPSPQAATEMAPNSMMQSKVPDSNTEPKQKEQPSMFASQEDFAPKKEFIFPDYADTDIEKIEYLIEKANNKLTNKDFQDITSLYRKIYDMFTKSEGLSPNERHLLSGKIQDLFQRIKRLYLIEGITV